MPEHDLPTIHGCACIVGAAGILIQGPSGSGKSTLCLALIDDAKKRGLFARLIGDDRLHLEIASGRVIANAPAELSGRIEIAGHGIVETPALPAGRIHIVASLVDGVERMPDADRTEISLDGSQADVPQIKVPFRNSAISVALIRAKLEELRLSFTL